ncbi:LytR C-terminal domain-containing protein [Phytoactinopolyspora halophila]|nr:LytR C-terminal domain-containing protein [Phytoactinopolyspora halophila]
MRERLDRAWPSLVALLGTVGVVVALLFLFGDDTDGDQTDDLAAGDDAGTDDGTDGDAGTEDTESTESPDDATDEPDDEESSGEDAEETDEPENPDEPDEPDEDEGVTAPPELRSPVGIANQTTIDGLELVAQDRLEDGGWEVAATGYYSGEIPETTVFFPPGYEEYAQALSEQFPEIGRVQPTIEGVNPDRLVVILVDDYLEVVDDEDDEGGG